MMTGRSKRLPSKLPSATALQSPSRLALKRRIPASALCVILAALWSALIPQGSLQLLAAAPPRILITEVMASNKRTVLDEDRTPNDWIELYNAGPDAVNLKGWHLTDTPKDLSHWSFPEVTVAPGEYLLVFASGKDRHQAGHELHTNFKLDADGEYLALVQPDGKTIAMQFQPKLPPLRPDVSYGIPLTDVTFPLISRQTPKWVSVPASDPGDAWKQIEFDAKGWASGKDGVGFDQSTNLIPLIGGDVSALMRGKSSSLLIRAPFRVTNDLPDKLALRMYYNDGFVAWLNGKEVARRNVEGNVAWNSAAKRPRGKSEPVLVSETFDADEGAYTLMNGGSNTRSRVLPVNVSSNRYLRLVNGRTENQVNGVGFHQAIAGAPKTLRSSFEYRIKGGEPRVNDLYMALIPTSLYGERGPGANLELFNKSELPDIRGGLVVHLAIGPGGVGSRAEVISGGKSESQRSYNEPSLSWRFFHLAFLEVEFTDQGALVSLSVTTDARGGTGKKVQLLNKLLVADAKPVSSRLQMVAHTRSDLATVDLDSVSTEWQASNETLAEDIDITPFKDQLRPGANVLAILGLNASASDTNFLILPELYGYRTQLQLDSPRFFSPATPLAANTDPGFGSEAPPPQISPKGVMLRGPVRIEMKTPLKGGVVRYTTDGREVTETSPVCTGSIEIADSAVIKARTYAPGYLPSRSAMECYNTADASLGDFSSTLPIILLTAQGRPSENRKTPLTARVILPGKGRATLAGEADLETRGDFNIRGFSSTRYPKKSYTLRLRDEFGDKVKTGVAGLPKDSDWVLYAPYPDKTLMRDVLAYELSRQMGHYAPRTRFVELFVNQGGGSIDRRDYLGVYVLVEKIKRGKNRVNIAELGPGDNAEPEISGGYIFKRDHSNHENPAFVSRGGEYFMVDPDPQDVTPAQRDWLERYFHETERSIYGKNFMDPQRGYRRYIDVSSFLDLHWLIEMSKNIDGFRYSVYFSKDRGGKLKCEPAWDWNLSFGNPNYLDGDSPSGWYTDELRDSEISWFRRLVQDPEFNQLQIDRWWELRRSVFQPETILKRIDQIAAELSEAQGRNFRRWPILGQYIHPNAYAGSSYEEEISYLKSWIRKRINWIDGQIGQPPSLSTRTDGGVVRLTAKGRGQLYYTTDGSDPRQAGGEPSPTAKVYQSPVALTGLNQVIVRGRNGNGWTAPTVWQAAYGK